MAQTKIIRGGTIVTASDKYRGDIVIEGETIRAIGKNLKPFAGTEAIDARGKLIFPGGIDVHVHLQLPFCGTVSSDDFENGSKAAACGGITTLVDYAIQTKGKRLMDAVKARRAEADGRVCVDYSLHGGITDWNDRTRKEIKEAIDYGIPTFKMFMIYKDEGWMADDGILYNGLEETARWGGMIMVHAESVFILELLINRYHTAPMMKKYGAYAHALSRPSCVEEEAIIRAIKWAEVTGGNLYIVHMSTGAGADAVKAGREKGVNVWAETGPQYLLLDDSVFRKKNGHRYATCPQIKKKEDSARLWKALQDGEVAVIATDTCTFTSKQKAMWKGDFTKIPFGLPGIETMVPLMYTFGVGGRRISLNRFVQLVSTNPAKLHGLYPRKGTIAVGADADIVIFDPKKKVALSHRKLQTNCDWSPFEGYRLAGYPHMTFSRGKLVARDGKFVGDVGHGRFVKRKPGGWKLLR